MILLGEKHTLYRLLQEIFRMRGIKIFMRLFGIDTGVENKDELHAVNKENTQTVELAVTEDVLKAIFAVTRNIQAVEENLPSLREIIIFCIHNEAKIIEQINYNSYKQKIHNVIRRAVLDKIYDADSVGKVLGLYEEFQSVLVTEVQDDPKVLFGLIEEEKPTKDVLEFAIAKAFEVIKGSSSFTPDEKKKVWIALTTIEDTPMPKTVTVSTNGKEMLLNLTDDLDKQTTIEIENENEDENDLQNETENELDTHNQQQLPSAGYFEEWEWSDKITAENMDWIIYVPYEQAIGSVSSTLLKSMTTSLKSMWGSKPKDSEIPLTPPLFSVRDVAYGSPSPACKAVAGFFDQRLWMTNNFLPTVTRRLMDSTVDFPSIGQRELFEVLVFAEETTNGLHVNSMGCLSQHEAAWWREKLAKRSTNKKLQVFLYDTQLRTIVAGDQIERKKLINDVAFQRLEVQLKYLNGEAEIKEELMSALEDWVREMNPKALEKAFQTIHSERNKKNYEGSNMDVLFSKLNKKQI